MSRYYCYVVFSNIIHACNEIYESRPNIPLIVVVRTRTCRVHTPRSGSDRFRSDELFIVPTDLPPVIIIIVPWPDVLFRGNEFVACRLVTTIYRMSGDDRLLSIVSILF